MMKQRDMERREPSHFGTFRSLIVERVVKLTKNWRSHPSILHFPNDIFYGGDLEPCGDRAITYSLARWNRLVSQGFPIIFHGLSGKDMREGSSPSYFNIDEAVRSSSDLDSGNLNSGLGVCFLISGRFFSGKTPSIILRTF